MDYCRPCGCKGRRSCLVCEQEYNIRPTFNLSDDEKENGYLYCHQCQKAWPGWNVDVNKNCLNHEGQSISVPGIYVQPNFITDEEKEKILEGMSREQWDLSQSGRRKQNYGPKCNFKKNKVQIGNFKGFPSYSKFVHDKLKALPILKNYRIIEQCSLEYDPVRGSSIDPHIDDCWIWGERIVTVNVLGDSYLTMSKFKGDFTKYNLSQVKSYHCVVNKYGCPIDHSTECFCFNDNNCEKIENVTLRIFMPEKSIIILYGSARYEWEHYVLREDINNLRICLAFREFTPPYLPGGEKEMLGSDILKVSEKFW